MSRFVPGCLCCESAAHCCNRGGGVAPVGPGDIPLELAATVDAAGTSPLSLAAGTLTYAEGWPDWITGASANGPAPIPHEGWWGEPWYFCDYSNCGYYALYYTCFANTHSLSWLRRRPEDPDATDGWIFDVLPIAVWYMDDVSGKPNGNTCDPFALAKQHVQYYFCGVGLGLPDDPDAPPGAGWCARPPGKSFGIYTIADAASGRMRMMAAGPPMPTLPIGRPDDPPPARELVVARYREGLGWLDGIDDLAGGLHKTVYNKGRDDVPGATRRPAAGREAGTWLRHIVEHYDDLADWTFFVQGAPHGDDLGGRLAVDYPGPTPLTRQYLPDFPSPAIKARDRVEWHGGHEVRYGRADHHGGREAGENEAWLDAVWGRWMAGPRPDPWWFGYAAEWAVPREAIRARPLAFWRHAMESVEAATVDPPKWDSDPANAWAFEILWYYLFAGPAEFPHKEPSADGEHDGGPGLVTMAGNFARSAAAHVAGGMRKASAEVQDARKATCLACIPYHDPVRDACKKCGCSLPTKRSWATERCPDGRWAE